MDRRQSSQITGGIILIVIGVIFLSQRVWALDGVRMDRLWPLFLIVPGMIRLLFPGEGRGSGFMLIFVGSLLLLHTYDILPMQKSWPLFIVLAGVSMLFGRSHRRGARTDLTPKNSDQPASPQAR